MTSAPEGHPKDAVFRIPYQEIQDVVSEQGRKDDAGKPQCSLVLHGFARALLAVSEVATHPVESGKYSADNWRAVPDGVRRYTDAMQMHHLHEAFEKHDPEDGMMHAAKTAWNALARLELMLMTDDQREAYEERAGILEFDAGMTRSDAEKMAAKMVADDEEAEFMMGSDK